MPDEHDGQQVERLYVASLSDYNKRHPPWPVGRRLLTRHQFHSAVQQMLVASPWTIRTGEPAEEWLVLDTERKVIDDETNAGTVTSEQMKGEAMITICSGLNRCTGDNWHRSVSTTTLDNHLVIDLQACKWCDSGFLVRLACLIDAAVADSNAVRIECGRDPSDAVQYASRLGLKRLCDELGVENDIPITGSQPANARFVELQRFGGADIADELLDIIDQRLAQWEDNSLTSLVYNQLLELGINIEEHAGTAGFVMAQWYPTGERLEIGVADLGIGIRASLEAAGRSYESDIEAIRDAVETRASRKGVYGGAGLSVMRDDARRYRGSLVVSSGQGQLTFTPDGLSTESIPLYAGTAVDLAYSWR